MTINKYSFISTSTGSNSSQLISLLDSFKALKVPKNVNATLYFYDQNPKINSKILSNYSDINIVVINSKRGVIPLSIARNDLLELIDEGYVLFSDDDAYYPEEFLNLLDNEIRLRTSFSLGFFKLMNIGSGSTYGNRKYPKLSKQVNINDAINLCISLNIVIDVSLIKLVSGFDTRLGVGSEFGCGEETDLILKCLSLPRIQCFYFETPIAYHPQFSWDNVDIKKVYSYSYGYRRMLFLNKRSNKIKFILLIHYLIVLIRSFVGMVIIPKQFKLRCHKIIGLLGIKISL